LPWLESLPSFCTGCGSKAPNSSGHQRRLPINLHSRTTEFPPTSGNQRPCRDAGVGAIAPGFAMLKRAKRASHIDPPASSYAIMRRASPYRGENPGPGEDVEGELETRPGIREHPGSEPEVGRPDSITSLAIVSRWRHGERFFIPNFLLAPRSHRRRYSIPTDPPRATLQRSVGPLDRGDEDFRARLEVALVPLHISPCT
jgi:hypothetical protein